MTKLFDILPGWIWALITVGALASAGLSEVRLSKERAAHADTRTKYAEQVAQAEAATRAESEKNRRTEQELRDAQDQNEQQAQALLAALDGARTLAAVANQRLRDAAQDLAAVARSRCAASATPGYSTPGSGALDLLAELLGESDDAAAGYAAAADESRIRGLTCERAYDTARQALSG